MTGPELPDQDSVPVYVISVAAKLAGMHPQTLRTYDRLGLVSPDRTAGRNRRYSASDIATLLQVVALSAEGLNLEGIRRVLALERQLMALTEDLRVARADLDRAQADADQRVAAAHSSYRRDLVPVERGSVVIWQRSRGHRG
jgi:MerR family transcriptional regulator/heat shock protein HspR